MTIGICWKPGRIEEWPWRAPSRRHQMQQSPDVQQLEKKIKILYHRFGDLLGGEVRHESGAVLDQLWGVAEQSAHSNLEHNMVKN